MEHVREESPLCHALKRGAEASIIEKLLKNENLFELACKRHLNPFSCVASGDSHRLLTADVVQLLINVGRNQLEGPNWYGSNPLAQVECALSFTNCEVAAMALLMDHPEVDINDQTATQFLRLALSNSHCNLDTIEFLIDLGAKLNKQNENETTALQVALTYERQPSIIQLLIEKGCLVNEEYDSVTPLTSAIKVGSNPDVVWQLLAAGARMNSRHIFNNSYFNNCSDEKWQKILHCAKIVVKHSYLKNDNFDFKDWIRECEHCETILDFAEKCVLELRKMKLQKIGRRHTLYQFIKSCFVPLMDVTTGLPMTRDFDYQKFLKCVAPDDAFPIYFNIISSKIGNMYLKAKLMEIPLYTNTVKHKMEIVLNSDCMSAIADFLSEDDMLRFILAFDDTSNGDPASTDSKGVGKRGRAQSANFLKRPKRHQ